MQCQLSAGGPAACCPRAEREQVLACCSLPAWPSYRFNAFLSHCLKAVWRFCVNQPGGEQSCSGCYGQIFLFISLGVVGRDAHCEHVGALVVNSRARAVMDGFSSLFRWGCSGGTLWHRCYRRCVLCATVRPVRPAVAFATPRSLSPPLAWSSGRIPTPQRVDTHDGGQRTSLQAPW
jgi:hypothetical protein